MRVRWFLTLTGVLALVVAATLVVYDRLDGFSTHSDQVIGPVGDTAADGATTTTTARGRAPDPDGPGLVRVEGTVTAAELTGAVLDPRLVPTPLTLESGRGFGNGGDVTGVHVGGEPGTIAWDGGRPFVLSSGPGLVLDPVTVSLTPEGLRATLGGGAHGLAPGSYRLNTPVAVGRAGVAAAADAVTFDAGPDAQLEAGGDTGLVLGPTGSWRSLGPGSVRLEGSLTVDRAESGQAAAVLELRSGAYELTFAPLEGGGWAVSGVLESTVVGDLSLG